MTTRSLAWLIPFALLGVSACSSSPDISSTPDDPPPDGVGLPSAPSDPAPPDASPEPPLVADALIASVTSIELGAARPGFALVTSFDLSNIGTTDIVLTPSTFAVPPPLEVASDCPTVLAPGASCFVLVDGMPTEVGDITGTLTIVSSANTLSLPVHAAGAYEVEIRRSDIGDGRVISDPAGIDCRHLDGTCEALFTTPVTLTAIPPPDGSFLGWDPACGDTGPTCVVPVQGPDDGIGNYVVALTALFQSPPPPSHRVTVTYAGGSTGEVAIVDDDDRSRAGTTHCGASPCVADIPIGHHVTLWGFASSQFGGWTAGCVATTHDCVLGALTSDRTAEVTFNRDPQEVVSFLPEGIGLSGVAFAPDGGLYVSALEVRKMRIDGTIEWVNPTVAFDLASDAAGNVYAADAGTTVFSLSPTGALRWSKTVPNMAPPFDRLTNRVQVSSDGTIVALQTSNGARVLDGNGNDRFAITGVTGGDGFAVAADGTIAIGVPAAAVNRRDIRRWTRDGTPLPTIPSIPSNFDVALAFDASDAVCAMTVGAGVETVSRTRADRVQVFRSSALTGFSSLDPMAAIGVDGDGVIAAARSTEADLSGGGLHIDTFSPTGVKTFTLEKRVPAPLPRSPITFDGVQIGRFVVDRASRRMAAVGVYAQRYPWIEVLDIPATP